MNNIFHFKKLFWTGLTLIVLAGMVGCGSTAPATSVTPSAEPSTAPVEVPTQRQTPAAPAFSSITLVIPEDPPSFNALISDTGYDGF